MGKEEMRSRLETIMAVLDSLREGPLLVTHVMMTTRTNWKDAHFALRRLTDRKLVEKVNGRGFRITNEGFSLLAQYAEMATALGVDARDESKKSDGSGTAAVVPRKPNQYTSLKCQSGPESPKDNWY